MEKNGEKMQLQIIEKSADESANFERAILLTGYGRYHVVLTLVCGLTSVACGFQNGLSSYVLPAAQCDLELSSKEMGLLNAAFLMGGTLSAMLWGVMADAIGRRDIMVWCLLIDGSVTLISGLSQSFIVFFIFRIISGFMIGGPATISNSFIGEFHPQKTRGTAICYLGIFWTISWLLLPGLAWIIIPLNFEIVVYGIVFNSWRLFVSILGLPSLLSAFLMSKYPESPKFLLSQGENKKALQIMRGIFVSNTNKQAHEYPVSTLIHDGPMSNRKDNSVRATLNTMWVQLCYLFSPPLLKYMSLYAIIIFTNVFGYCGLGSWFPELFNRFEAYYKSHPNQTVTVCELAFFREESLGAVNSEIRENLTMTSNLTSEVGSMVSNFATAQLLSSVNLTRTCDSFVDPKVFVNSITIGFSCLLGNFASVYLTGRLESRVMPIVTMVIPGICGCLIYFLRSSTQNLIAACIFSSFLSTAGVVIHGVMLDVFPTNANSMAVSAACLAGRFGGIISNILFGFLLDISCEIPILLVGGVVIFGGLLGFLIPKNPRGVSEQMDKIVRISDDNLLQVREKRDPNFAS